MCKAHWHMYALMVNTSKVDFTSFSQVIIELAEVWWHFKSMPTINDSECWTSSSRRAGCMQEWHGWHNHVNLSLTSILFDICSEVSLFSGLSSGPSAHLGLCSLIISLFFLMLCLTLLSFPSGVTTLWSPVEWEVCTWAQMPRKIYCNVYLEGEVQTFLYCII